jgi:hypothetical protein
MHLSESLARTAWREPASNSHEQASAIEADNYGKCTNRLGVRLVTTVPGGDQARSADIHQNRLRRRRTICHSGAKILIRDHQPLVAACSYHVQNHLWTIPLLLFDPNPELAILQRQHSRAVEDLVTCGVPYGRWLDGSDA